MVAKSNASKTPRFESWPNLIKTCPNVEFLFPPTSDAHLPSTIIILDH
jgi:hypothetical protein